MRILLAYGVACSLAFAAGLFMSSSHVGPDLAIAALAVVAWALGAASPWIRGGSASLLASMGAVIVYAAVVAPDIGFAKALTMGLLIVVGLDGLDLVRRTRARLRATSGQADAWVANVVRLHAARVVVVMPAPLVLLVLIKEGVPTLVSRYAAPRFAASLEAAQFGTPWLVAATVFAILAACLALPARWRNRDRADAANSTPQATKQRAPPVERHVGAPTVDTGGELPQS